MPTSATAARMERLRVTAEEVSAMASYLGVDLRKDEFWLLPIARAAAEEPVPKPWEEMEDDQGNPYFVNPKSGKSSRRHPMDKQFLELVHSARKRGMPPGNMKQTWMSFTNEDGTTVYHDFSIGASSGTPPPEEEMIPEMPDGKRPKYDGFRFEATTLEKREASLKNLQYLTFQTWWDEDAEDADLTLRVDGATTAGGGMTRRHMKIIFDLKTQHFEAWDLHIGAQLKVLGRLVTLNSASLETTQWLEGKAVALGKLKGSLLATLKKYNTAARPAAQASVYGLKRVNRHGRAELQPGTMSLRVCIDASKKLIEEVGKYRPSVAAENLKILEGIISLG